MPRAQTSCPGSPESVARARAFVASTLAEWDASEYEWPALLVVSELATNAVLHARTPYEVCLILTDDCLTIEVHDGSLAAPTRRRYGLDATTGRGMRLVTDMCDGWQVDIVQTGKIVRCALPRQRQQRDEPPDDEAAGVDLESVLASFPDDLEGNAGAVMNATRARRAG